MWANRTEIMGETQGQPWGREEDQEEEETPRGPDKGSWGGERGRYPERRAMGLQRRMQRNVLTSA